jgi:hypothetical protein
MAEQMSVEELETKDLVEFELSNGIIAYLSRSGPLASLLC